MGGDAKSCPLTTAAAEAPHAGWPTSSLLAPAWQICLPWTHKPPLGPLSQSYPERQALTEMPSVSRMAKNRWGLAEAPVPVAEPGTPTAALGPATRLDSCWLAAGLQELQRWLR